MEEETLLIGLLLVDCLACFSVRYRTACPGVAAILVPGPPISSLIEHMPYGLAYRPSDGGIFSVEVPLPREL